MHEIVLSCLKHTWLIDLDGTLVKHNGYLIDGEDSLLPCGADFIAQIPEDDMIILLTSRREEYRNMTETFLKKNGVRYDYIIFNIPFGERIVINDKKQSGMETAKAINFERNGCNKIHIVYDESI